MDWADRIVQKVSKNVHEGLLEHYLNREGTIREIATGTYKPKHIPSRIAIITVLETLLEDFPDQDYDYNEGMEKILREAIKQIKERGNL